MGRCFRGLTHQSLKSARRLYSIHRLWQWLNDAQMLWSPCGQKYYGDNKQYASCALLHSQCDNHWFAVQWPGIPICQNYSFSSLSEKSHAGNLREGYTCRVTVRLQHFDMHSFRPSKVPIEKMEPGVRYYWGRSLLEHTIRVLVQQVKFHWQNTSGWSDPESYKRVLHQGKKGSWNLACHTTCQGSQP